jgi:hypothetical protein
METIDVITKIINFIILIVSIITPIIAYLNKILNNKLNPISSKIDNNEKDRLRYEILSFANSLRNGNKHTRQEFETIFFFYDKYETIITELKQKNGYLEEEMKFIKESYERRELVI